MLVCMTCSEIVHEIRQLPVAQQVEVHQALTGLLNECKPGQSANDIAAAARALRDDYANDRELTAFTSLDSEDFHATQ
jgi:hypothetical protein